MEKKRFENLLLPGKNTLISELSEEERKKVYEVFGSHGMTTSRIYLRIFRTGYGSGFSEWEIRGINRIVRDYAEEYGMDISSMSDFSCFYEKIEGKQKFWDYMNRLGMGKNSAIYRFKNWNFQDWELVGVESIIDEIAA